MPKNGIDITDYMELERLLRWLQDRMIEAKHDVQKKWFDSKIEILRRILNDKTS